MSESKTYVFGNDANNGVLGCLAPLLQKQGLDPNKADYLGSSIENERQLAMYVKDTIDDSDASDETTFRRWVATMIGNGTPIDWYEIC